MVHVRTRIFVYSHSLVHVTIRLKFDIINHFLFFFSFDQKLEKGKHFTSHTINILYMYLQWKQTKQWRCGVTLVVNYYFLIICAKTVKTHTVKQWQRVLSKKLCKGLPITRESVERWDECYTWKTQSRKKLHHQSSIQNKPRMLSPSAYPLAEKKIKQFLFIIFLNPISHILYL